MARKLSAADVFGIVESDSEEENNCNFKVNQPVLRRSDNEV